MESRLNITGRLPRFIVTFPQTAVLLAQYRTGR